MTNIEYVGPIYFGMIPKNGTFNGISDGNYGFAVKGCEKKIIYNSELKKTIGNHRPRRFYMHLE